MMIYVIFLEYLFYIFGRISLNCSHLKELDCFAWNSESHRFQKFGKSVTSGSNSLFSKCFTFGDVLLWHSLSFFNSIIDESGSNLPGFMSPDSWIHAWVDFALWVFFHDSSSNGSLVNPVIISEWNFFGNVEFVKNFIPNSMKFFSSIMTFCWEIITSFITSWVFVINSSNAMKWLMDISQIVHQKSDSVGESKLFGSFSSIFYHLVFSYGLNRK